MFPVRSGFLPWPAWFSVDTWQRVSAGCASAWVGAVGSRVGRPISQCLPRPQSASPKTPETHRAAGKQKLSCDRGPVLLELYVLGQPLAHSVDERPGRRMRGMKGVCPPLQQGRPTLVSSLSQRASCLTDLWAPQACGLC